MLEIEAIQMAKNLARQSGWIWKEPIIAVKKRKWLLGKFYWSITSNSESKGLNVRVLVDDSTGQILKSSFSKR